MKRTHTVAYEFTQDETDLLVFIREAARDMAAAREERNTGIHRAVALGLPVRVVGEYASLSGAQVSRLTSTNGGRP